jgi:hypothetical protein
MGDSNSFPDVDVDADSMDVDVDDDVGIRCWVRCCTETKALLQLAFVATQAQAQMPMPKIPINRRRQCRFLPPMWFYLIRNSAALQHKHPVQIID